jgi:sialic acid synthase SpsE
MLCVKRPGYGIAPKFLQAVVGRVALRDIDCDDVVTWDAL